MIGSAARRVLLLAPFPPRLDASHGGARVIAQWIGSAADRHEIALLCLRSPRDEPIGPRVRERCASVLEIGREAGYGNGMAAVGALLAGTPPWPAKFRSGAFADHLARRVRAWKPDIVEAHFHLTAQHLARLEETGVRRVYVSHEPGADHARASAVGRSAPRRFAGRFEERLWRRFERRLLDRMDVAVALTERDRRALEGLGSATPVARIPLGHDVPSRALDPVGTSPPSVLFVGGFRHPPNLEAALRLATRIFPALRARHQDLVLDLVGPDPPRRLERLAGDGVRIHGRVRDVTPWLDRAAVVLAPLRHGGGTRVKVLEALAAGKAVVASPLALEGIDAPRGSCVAVADDDEAWVRAVGGLLDDPGGRRQMATAARAWAAAHLGWERSAEALSALYEELCVGAEPGHAVGRADR